MMRLILPVSMALMLLGAVAYLVLGLIACATGGCY